MTESSNNLTVKLPDGTPLQLGSGATGADAALAIGEGLARAALAIRVSDEIRDLLAAEGILLKDTPDGTTWTRK